MSVPHCAPSRILPARPSLAQLRKQAKELLKSYRAGESAAVAEVGKFERQPDPATFVLADAQRVLARAYGYSSWSKLKYRVDVLSNVETFIRAVKTGDVAAVRRLAKSQPELVFEWSGDAAAPGALYFAVTSRLAEMTRCLIELGCNPRTGLWPHRDATAPCMIAKDRGYDEIVAIIEQDEARRRQEMSSPGATISSKTDEILKAIMEDRCDDAKRLLESDPSLIGACNNGGAMPLHIAAWKHNPGMVAWLLERQAPVDALAPTDVPSRIYEQHGVSGKTPLDYAAMVAGWSAHGRHYTYMENSGIEPSRFDETARLLRSRGAVLTPRAAVAIGDRDAILRIHREGGLGNEIHGLRGGLLSIAVRVNRIEMVALLLDLGLDPDESTADEGDDRSWGMPLWFAALCGRHKIAELLLARGADVNAIVYASGDALGNAQETRDEEMRALLLKHGASITVEGISDAQTAKAVLDGTLSAQSLNVREPTHTDLAEQLLWSSVGSDPEIVRLCLPHMTRPGNDPWWHYVFIHTALPESLRPMLEHGVHPDVSGDGGFTALHHLGSAYVGDQHRVALATILLDAGASLTKRDPLLRSTPLGWACRWGRADLVQLYLDRGADPREPDAEPWATPRAWAEKGEHREILELLRSRAASHI